MRDGIKACPENWTNCSMYVQDPVLLSTNITAELTKQDVDNFRKMCKLYKNYVLKINRVNPGSSTCSSSIMSLASSMNVLTINDSQSTDIVTVIENDMLMLKNRSLFIKNRENSENDIFSILTQYIHTFDSSLKVYSCGSTQYNIRMQDTNFNILVTTSNFLLLFELLFVRHEIS